MKRFEEPMIETAVFTVADIITTSGTEDFVPPETEVLLL